MNRTLLSFCFFLLIASFGAAQQNDAPTASMPQRQLALLTQLQQAREDTNKVNILLALCKFHWDNKRNKDTITSYSEKMIKLSRQLKFQKGINEGNYYQCLLNVSEKKFDKARAIVVQMPEDQQARLYIVMGEHFLFRPALKKADLDSAYSYFDQALQISRQSGLKKWKHESLIALGKYYFANDEFSRAKASFLEIIIDHQRSGDSLAEARVWSELGKYMPDTERTLEEQFSAHGNALKLYEALKDTVNEISVIEDLAGINMYHSKLATARELFQRALQLRNLIGKKNTLTDTRALAWICHAMGELDEALFYALAADEQRRQLELPEFIVDKLILGIIYGDIGQHKESLQYLLDINPDNRYWNYFTCRKVVEQYLALGQPREALAYVQDFEKKVPAERPADKQTLAAVKGDCYAGLNKFEKAEQYYLEMIRLDPETQKFKENEVAPLPVSISGAEAHYKIARFYVDQHKFNKAGPYLSSAAKIGFFSGNQFYTSHFMRDLSLLQFKVDSATGNYLSAIQHYQRYNSLNDSIFNAAKMKQLQQLQVKYETEKKELAIATRDEQISALKQNDLLRQRNLKQANFIRNITMAAVAVLVLFGGVLFWQYRQKKKANRMITAQNDQLQHLLSEKEWLLKEVHHRVKNNLHTIICLLESQAAFLEDDALKAIEKSQHRIYAMSLIHQKLYQTENVKTIEMANYLPEFIQYLKEGFGMSRIVIELDVEPIQLDASVAIPVALILNEAVTNSIKYAFPGGERGIIKVVLRRDGDHILLRIADNGIGMSRNLNDGDFNSLGVELMKGLTEDINGRIAFENDNGTKITILFKVNTISSVTSVLQVNELAIESI